jgi:hypothetical protein
MCVVMRSPLRQPVGLAEPLRFRHRVGKDIARRDIAALGDQLANELSPHPGAATGDDRDPSFEILHDVLPPLNARAGRSVGESSAGVSWLRPVVRSVREQCRQVEITLGHRGGVRKRSSSLSSAALYSGRYSASSSTPAPATILALGVGLAFLLPLAPLSLAYAGL